MVHVGLILQARHDSSRLPGKALAPLASTTVLQHCLERLRRSAAGQVVLATTARPADDRLAALARGMDISVYRGSRDDVLGRYVSAARSFGFDVVIRATGDNPAVDIDAAERLLRTLEATAAEYACEDGLPVGAGVEAVTAAALARSAALAQDPADREHVTTFIKAHPGLFRIARPIAPAALRRPDLRLTIDTPADLGFMRRVYARLAEPEPSLAAVIEAADACTRSDAA